MSWPTFLFSILGIATVVCSVGVVVTRDIVRAAVWLLLALCGTAGLFFFLGADFVAAVQLLVYVGGTLVLVIFGVMLTARGPFVRMQTGSGEWTLSAIVGFVLFAVIVATLMSTTWPRQGYDPGTGKVLRQAAVAPKPAAKSGVASAAQKPTSADAAAQSPSASQIGMYFLGLPPLGDTPKDVAHPRPPTPGETQREATRPSALVGYLLPFEIVSVHLLVVLIGAAYLARTKRRKAATP
jgi:NADH:ubiquinone oxidoreductase subunit 6 (subunit J)